MDRTPQRQRFRFGISRRKKLFECSSDVGQEMLETADKDGTGSLDIIEFLQMMREKVKDQNKEKEIAEAFTVFDVVRFVLSA